MAFTTVATAVTGQTYTAANYNTYVRDNFTAVWVYTTAGDLSYATSGTSTSRLGIGGAGQLLGVNAGATAPEWTGGLSTASALFSTTPYSYDVNTERNVPSSFLSVPVNVTSTVVILGQLVAFCAVEGKHGYFLVRFDGVNYDTAAKIGTASLGTVALFGMFTGVTSGNKNVFLREKPEFGGNAVNVDQWAYSVIVIPE